MELTLTFARERETKNTVRFAEVVEEGEKPVVGVIYLQKSILEASGALDAESVTVLVTATAAETTPLSLV